MRICVSCGESYEEERTICPWCGCPADKFPLPPWLFSEIDQKRYVPIGRRLTGWSDWAWIIWDDAGQQKAEAVPIPGNETGRRHFELLQKRMGLQDPGGAWFPRLLDLKWIGAQEGGYYLCEWTEGVTLREALEREKPLAANYAQLLEANLAGLSTVLEEVSGEKANGRIPSDSIFFPASGGVRFSDYEVLYSQYPADQTQGWHGIYYEPEAPGGYTDAEEDWDDFGAGAWGKAAAGPAQASIQRASAGAPFRTGVLGDSPGRPAGQGGWDNFAEDPEEEEAWDSTEFGNAFMGRPNRARTRSASAKSQKKGRRRSDRYAEAGANDRKPVSENDHPGPSLGLLLLAGVGLLAVLAAALFRIFLI